MYFPRTNDDKPIGRLVKNNFTADYYTKRPAISLFYREVIIQKEVFKYQKRKHNTWMGK